MYDSCIKYLEKEQEKIKEYIEKRALEEDETEEE